MLVTDTLPVTEAAPIAVCSVAPLLADAIGRLHDDKGLDDLLHP
jgi:ribose-phosphate pyrophosphokinase